MFSFYYQYWDLSLLIDHGRSFFLQDFNVVFLVSFLQIVLSSLLRFFSFHDIWSTVSLYLRIDFFLPLWLALHVYKYNNRPSFTTPDHQYQSLNNNPSSN